MKQNIESHKIIFTVVMLSLALAIRQMSMTIVSPFISTYCKSLEGYTPLLAGLAVGAFGLMQAILQIPFGVLSDRFGDKKIMIGGLSLVIIGFIIAYFAKSIGMLILARALQGSGAVIGVGYSWVASISDCNNQSKAMSILGAMISASAALAFAAGPLLREVMDVNQMFLMGAILLTLNTLYILIFLQDKKMPSTSKIHFANACSKLLNDHTFVTMNLGAFLNNFMMMAVFFAAPIYMDQVIGQKQIWKIFIPAIVVAIFFMKAMVLISQNKKVHLVLSISFLISAFSIIFYFNSASFLCLLLGTMLYLCGYVAIATITASHVNKLVTDELRGTANGIFNSFQYIGSFAGAVIMGILWGCSQTAAWSVVIAIGVIGLIIINIDYHFGLKRIDCINQ